MFHSSVTVKNGGDRRTFLTPNNVFVQSEMMNSSKCFLQFQVPTWGLHRLHKITFRNRVQRDCCFLSFRNILPLNAITAGLMQAPSGLTYCSFMRTVQPRDSSAVNALKNVIKRNFLCRFRSTFLEMLKNKRFTSRFSPWKLSRCFLKNSARRVKTIWYS